MKTTREEKPRKRALIRNLQDVMRHCEIDAQGCWLWNRAMNGDGGRTPIIYSLDYERGEKRCQSGSKAVFQIAHNRAVRPGYLVLRCCLKRRCLRPQCLIEVASRAEIGARVAKSGMLKGSNMEQRIKAAASGRKSQGKKDLGYEIIAAIRNQPEEKTGRQIAEELGLSESRVSRIRRGDTYRNIAEVSA